MQDFDTGHLFSNSNGSILMYKAHLASQLLTTLTLQFFRAIFLLHLNVGNDEDSFVLDLNQRRDCSPANPFTSHCSSKLSGAAN